MNNWLITADLHINDYSQYNYSKGFRLNQFIKLANRLVELSVDNNCSDIVIAGDIIDLPTNRPYVVNIIYKVLKIISENFDKVYYILGQHDLDTKSNNINKSDTIITALEFPNFNYMDQKIITSDSGKKIGFKNWTPDQDLSWIDDKVDVLIAHYTKSGMFGQSIDESKFNLMIHGDIHNSQEIGKFISIGNPSQKDMSSQGDGTAIVFNPESCKWKRIHIDDDHSRFLRMSYTDDKSEEGFRGELQYNIYKPKLNNTSNNDISSSIPNWTQVDDLISTIVKDRGLEKIHDEVKSKNPKFTEIDFNFSLKSLKVHGYRSIVDLEITFDGNDRIVLVGDNGSGKSSIVNSLKSIFEKSREMKGEKSDFTDYVKIDLEFNYQNKLYHVWRGSNENGIEIDGNKLNYNNKTEFENDVYNQLPFLNYIDLFFITSDVQNLSTRLSPERRINLLSKFYRLDRIAAYKSTAESIIVDKNSDISSIKSELDRKLGSLDIIEKRIQELSDYGNHKRTDYSDKVDELNNIMDKNSERKMWESKLEVEESKAKLHSDTLKSYSDRLSVNIDETRKLIKSTIDKKTLINNKITEMTTRNSRLVELNQIRTTSYNDGVRVKSDIDSLESGVCPTCGTRISNDSTKNKLKLLKIQLKKSRADYKGTIDEYNTYTAEELKPEFFKNSIKKLRDSLEDLNSEERIYSTKIDLYDQAKKDNDKVESELKFINIEIDKLKSDEPENVILPIDIKEKLFSATSELSKFDEYEKNVSDKVELENSIIPIREKINSIQDEINNYKIYSELVSDHGDIMKLILEKMAVSFSDNSIKYEVKQGVYRNKPFLRLDTFFKVKKTWRLYNSLSDGQKSISDLDFLTKLFSVRVGLLVMDETLKHLDFKMGPLAWEMINRMNVNTIIISTHDANFSNFSRKIDLALDSEGKTIATII